MRKLQNKASRALRADLEAVGPEPTAPGTAAIDAWADELLAVCRLHSRRGLTSADREFIRVVRMLARNIKAASKGMQAAWRAKRFTTPSRRERAPR